MPLKQEMPVHFAIRALVPQSINEDARKKIAGHPLIIPYRNFQS